MKTITTLAVLAFALSAHAYAGTRYSMSCDADGFEVPMSIQVQDGAAAAEVMWDGPGSAIFSAKYSHLSAVTANGQLTITQPTVSRDGAKPATAFFLVLRKNPAGKIYGKLHVVSNDGDKMTFGGMVSCSYRK